MALLPPLANSRDGSSAADERAPGRAAFFTAPAPVHSDQARLDELWLALQGELRRAAHQRLRGEGPGHTLSTTALLHEVYLKLAAQHTVRWNDKVQFLGLAAQAMRRLLIDHARRHQRIRNWVRYDSADAERSDVGARNNAVRLAAAERGEALLALDEALQRLAGIDERLVKVVEYRFFGGLSEEETALALGVNARTVRRDWVKARAWLQVNLGTAPPA